MGKDIRMVLVENREIVRRGLRLLLEPEDDMKVVGEYADDGKVFSKIGRAAQTSSLWTSRCLEWTRSRLPEG